MRRYSLDHVRAWARHDAERLGGDVYAALREIEASIQIRPLASMQDPTRPDFARDGLAILNPKGEGPCVVIVAAERDSHDREHILAHELAHELRMDAGYTGDEAEQVCDAYSDAFLEERHASKPAAW